MTTGELIKTIRKQKSITQKQLAEMCNIHRNTIYRYENGEISPPLEILKSIATALGCDTKELIGGDVMAIYADDEVYAINSKKNGVTAEEFFFGRPLSEDTVVVSYKDKNGEKIEKRIPKDKLKAVEGVLDALEIRDDPDTD